jgi:hypothetical protein
MGSSKKSGMMGQMVASAVAQVNITTVPVRPPVKLSHR